MSRARLVGGALVCLLVAGVVGPADADPAAAPAPPQAPVPTPVPTAPTTGLGGPAVDDPALDIALSEPVEDRNYPRRGDPGVDALHYGLALAWDPEAEVLTGTERIVLRATTDAAVLRLDLGAPLTVTAATLDGTPVTTRRPGDHLVVEAPVTAERRYVLELRYTGTPEPVEAPVVRSDFDTVGWTTTRAGEFWTMQEPFGALTWYAVNDHPSDKALYDISVTVPEPWRGVANGELVATTTAGGLVTSSWHLASPASSYLVTVAGGDFAHRTYAGAASVPVTVWFPRSFPELARPFRGIARRIAWVEERLGPYPFDSLGYLLVDSRSGMETQTMITLGHFATHPAVQVHEAAHQWWGDLVTPRDWRDLWLNEGMATYVQAVWQAHGHHRRLLDTIRYYEAAEPSLRRQHGPPADYEHGHFASSNAYYGPALMWHRLRERVGHRAFWRLARQWPRHRAFGVSWYADAVGWWSDHTDVPRPFFRRWLLAEESPLS